MLITIICYQLRLKKIKNAVKPLWQSLKKKWKDKEKKQEENKT